jgi:hypothetical protein
VTFAHDCCPLSASNSRPIGFGSYQPVVDALWRGHIDYAQVIKEYTSPSPEDQRWYSPATCKVTDINILNGEPDPAHISTSYVERQNLTMRMGIRRFTRLTNAFSKKIENLTRAISLHYLHYNFARPHQVAQGRPWAEDHPGDGGEGGDLPLVGHADRRAARLNPGPGVCWKGCRTATGTYAIAFGRP